LTPVVLARAAQLWQADVDTVVALLRVAAEVDFNFSLTHATAMAAAVARPHGRSAALAHLHDRVHDLVEVVTSAPAAQRRWRAIAGAFYPEGWHELEHVGRQQVERNLADILHDVTLSCLAVEVVADVADEALLLEGRGPWIRGISRGQLPSAPAWEAAADVRAVIGDLLRPLDGQGLATITTIHAFSMTGRVEGAADYPDVCGRLLSWATVSAAVCPRRLLDELPAWEPLKAAFCGTDALAPPELHAWATCLAAALTHRGRLSAEDVRVLTFLFEEHLPQLPALINEPVPALP
jgi:hypothetical protein